MVIRTASSAPVPQRGHFQTLSMTGSILAALPVTDAPYNWHQSGQSQSEESNWPRWSHRKDLQGVRRPAKRGIHHHIQLLITTDYSSYLSEASYNSPSANSVLAHKLVQKLSLSLGSWLCRWYWTSSEIDHRISRWGSLHKNLDLNTTKTKELIVDVRNMKHNEHSSLSIEEVERVESLVESTLVFISRLTSPGRTSPSRWGKPSRDCTFSGS